ncbi:iron reductase domain protein [Aaosphaeria arxii CBS 175.79]|uniref:Iron reductase domain protein n=1 Tax=Aaosphaeria arxii CBS 175.79 TaxID=1450172 RepID=A0A6A5XY59_9PLEO|nr:iron reductase domain protein [Aaosphaeria arxii CBS 175.79]KAF2018102.1 iron reductase domain protein [Aaosphaeria arxii CBS 175.79]
MKLSKTSVGLLASAGTVLGQNTKRYCDTVTGLCFSGWTGGNGVTIGVALPNATVAPFDTVLQMVSPIANGWVGFAWGGTMPYVPLTIGWVNNASNTAIYSSRMAYGLSLPQPFDGAEYSYLKGTGYNATHWTLTVRCRGCSQWNDVDGKLASIDPLGTAVKFAHGYTSRLPKEPANNRSTFNVHSSFGHWFLDLNQGQNANFDKLVADNLVPNKPPTPSSAPPSSSTRLPTSTLSTIIVPSSTGSPAPVSTSVPASCAGISKLHFPYKIASGWKAVKVAGDLTQPRGLIFDNAGHLLLVQNGLGITVHTIGPDGCLSNQKTLIAQRNINHGIALSPDGKTLYASSATSVFAWDYDSATQTVSSTSRTIITDMDARGHVTRTLAIPPKHPDVLVVSHGSNDNFDYESGNIKTGRSCVKGFNRNKVPTDGYKYASEGWNLGYGLRNGVGLAFDGEGMLWEVENASDEIHRTVGGTAIDIHIDNPADEINFIGDPSKENTQWYGYPTCYTVWDPSVITDKKFQRGDQFVLTPNETFSDNTCTQQSEGARLALQAHSAPLDAVFDKNYTSLYVTFHGSWNRAPSTGYKVVEVPYAPGVDGFGPKAQLNGSAGYTEIFSSPDEEHCSTTQCFRPVSIAKDKYERMYITSDSGAEGELIILGRS